MMKAAKLTTSLSKLVTGESKQLLSLKSVSTVSNVPSADNINVTSQNTPVINEADPIFDFSHEHLTEISKRLNLYPRASIKDLKKAAVLIPLCLTKTTDLVPDMKNGKTSTGLTPSVLFTLRSSTVGTHKGQVSFPGGKLDPTDKTIEECALRETWEEIGITSDKIKVLGKMSDFLSITNIAVTPVVGYIGVLEELNFKSNPDELTEIFTLPLHHLMNASNIQFDDLGKRGNLPAFVSTKQSHRVWGLSAIMLYTFMKNILKIDLPPPPRITPKPSL